MEINKSLYKALRVLIIVSSLGYFFYFLVTNVELFKQLQKFSIFSFAIIFLLKILNIFLLSNINLKILKNLNINLNNVESLDLVIKNTLGNLSSPFKLGSGYKLSYLMQKFDFKIKDYFLWTTFFSFINLYPLLLIFIIYSIVIEKRIVVQNLNIILLLFIPFFVILLLLKSKNFRSKFRNLSDYKYFSKNNLLIQFNNILFFLSTTTIILTIIQYFFNQINYFSSISYSSLSSFVNILNITPGNIGIKEGVIVLFENIHKIPYEIVLITSILERLFSFFSLFFVQLILKNKSNNF